jgi:hypothetical protein
LYVVTFVTLEGCRVHRIASYTEAQEASCGIIWAQQTLKSVKHCWFLKYSSAAAAMWYALCVMLHWSDSQTSYWVKLQHGAHAFVSQLSESMGRTRAEHCIATCLHALQHLLVGQTPGVARYGAVIAAALLSQH